MFASTKDLEFVQGQSRDVPDRELVLNIITQQEIVQIWSSLPIGSGARSPKVPSSIFSLKLLLLKICASDEVPLDPTLTQRNLYSASTIVSSIQGKETLVVVIVTARFLWLLHGDMLPGHCSYCKGDIQSGSEFFLYLFPVWNLAMIVWQAWGTNLLMADLPTSQ